MTDKETNIGIVAVIVMLIFMCILIFFGCKSVLRSCDESNTTIYQNDKTDDKEKTL